MTQLINSAKYYVIIILLCLVAMPAMAGTELDSDRDGVPDKDEIEIYYSDPLNPDTDGDGYNDGNEIKNGYSPLDPRPIKVLVVSQILGVKIYPDGSLLRGPDWKIYLIINGEKQLIISWEELLEKYIGQKIYNVSDEVLAQYPEVLGANSSKRIEVNLQEQKLYYFLNDVKMGEFEISSGKPSTPTPKGNFKIDGKALRAWSNYGLWMPYWMSLKNGYFGIHELPVWPNGVKEGADHLGVPVSHGCVRLGVGAAEFLYNWAPIGTAVKIY
jgi:hypothetical protein